MYTNGLLTLSLGDGSQPKDGDKYSMEEPMDKDADKGKNYYSKKAISDSVFETDTDESIILGFKEGRLPPCIKSICTKYVLVFKKSLTADKQTKFKPATMPIIQGAKPTRRAKTCRKTPLHWKRMLDEMNDALLKVEMNKKVQEVPSDFLFKAFWYQNPGTPRRSAHCS